MTPASGLAEWQHRPGGAAFRRNVRRQTIGELDEDVLYRRHVEQTLGREYDSPEEEQRAYWRELEARVQKVATGVVARECTENGHDLHPWRSDPDARFGLRTGCKLCGGAVKVAIGDWGRVEVEGCNMDPCNGSRSY